MELAPVRSNLFDRCLEGGDQTTRPRVAAALEDGLEAYRGPLGDGSPSRRPAD